MEQIFIGHALKKADCNVENQSKLVCRKQICAWPKQKICQELFLIVFAHQPLEKIIDKFGFDC